MKSNYRFDRATTINVAVFLAILEYSIYSLVCYSIEFNGHPFYGLPHMQPGFADLRLLTHSSGCSASIDELLKNTSNCDPWSRPFNYPPFSLTLLRLFNVDSTSTSVIGLTMGIIAILASIFVFFREPSSGLNLKILGSTLFIGSFPFQLALERGNYDLSILILLILFSLFVSKSRHLSGVLVTMTISLAAISSFLLSALKIFPAVGITIWYFAQKPKNRIKMEYLWTVCPAILGVAIQLSSIPSILANTPKPNGGVSFGLLALYQGIGLRGIELFYVISLIKLLVLFTTLYIYLKFFLKNKSMNFHTKIPVIFSLSFCIIASVYILSRSWDYRLIFLVFMLPFIANLYSSQKLKIMSKSLPLSLILGASIVFVVYEQYVKYVPYIPGKLGFWLSIFSDAVVQPALFVFFALDMLNLDKKLSLK